MIIQFSLDHQKIERLDTQFVVADSRNYLYAQFELLSDDWKPPIIAEIKAEQTLLVYGVLACLKGLKEQGCNGPVTEAINKIEKHINKKAHDQET